MKEFIKSFFSFGLATTIEKIIAFLLLPIYARVFTKIEFGVIDLVQVVLGIVSILAVLQLESALQRYYFEYKGKVKKIFISTLFIFVFIASCLITLILFFLSGYISLLIFGTVEYKDLIKISSFQLPIINFSMLGFVLLRYEKRNVRFVSIILFKVVLTLISILLLVVWNDTGIIGVFIAQLIGAGVSSFLLLFSIRDSLSFVFSKRLFLRSFKYAIPQFPARVGSVMLSFANRFFMVGYLSLGAIGIYSFSLKLASAIQLVYAAFIMAWAPFMFEQLKKPGHKEVFVRVLPVVSGPIFLIVTLISLFSKEVVLLVASAEFKEAFYFVGALSLSFSLLIFKEVIDIGPKYTEKTKYLSYTFFCSLTINLVSLALFIRLWGLEGVVYSMLMTNTFLLVMSWMVSNKLYYIPHNILNFIILAVPSYFLAVGSMFYTPSFLIRVGIALGLLIFYGVFFVKGFKNFKIKAVTI